MALKGFFGGFHQAHDQDPLRNLQAKFALHQGVQTLVQQPQN